MSTTNLISKSLGDILTQSGNGSPTHNAAKGSLYVDEDSATLYINKDGFSVWENLQTVSYGEVFFQENTTSTSIPSSNTWLTINTDFSSNNNNNGWTVSNNTMVLGPGRGGRYQITANVTLFRVQGSPQYEVGVSKNNAAPVSGTYNGTSLSNSYKTGCISINYFTDLNAGDNLRLTVRNLTGTQNIIIKHAQIFATKIN